MPLLTTITGHVPALRCITLGATGSGGCHQSELMAAQWQSLDKLFQSADRLETVVVDLRTLDTQPIHADRLRAAVQRNLPFLVKSGRLRCMQ